MAFVGALCSVFIKITELNLLLKNLATAAMNCFPLSLGMGFLQIRATGQNRRSVKIQHLSNVVNLVASVIRKGHSCRRFASEYLFMAGRGSKSEL